MNKHFEDTRYYLRRAAETASVGVKEELEPVEQRFREMSGREEEPEPSRIEKIQADLVEIETKAEGEARKAVENARGRLEAYRAGSD